MNEELSEQRLDKWLWCTRLVKSRSLAAKLIEAGDIRVNRVRVTKASVTIKCGDVITATIHTRIHVIEVLALAERRGPSSEARTLYRDRLLDQNQSTTE